MSDLADDELLSAYLDGELTADERARVERSLAEQPERRQLLDELRAMKTSLERMPRARLGRDFADQVLRQTEKEVLTTGGTKAAGSGTSGVELAERGGRPGGFRLQRMRRPLVWASLTLAAGLALMFLDRERMAPRKVALAPGVAGGREGGEIGAPAGAPVAEPPELPLARTRQAAGESDHDRRSEPSAAPADLGLEKESAKDDRRHPAVADDEMSANAEASEGRSLIASDQTLVVWCYVAPGADYDGPFRELLAEQNIKWGEDAPVAALDALARESLEDQVAITEERAKPLAGRSARSNGADAARLDAALRKRVYQQGQRLRTDAEQALREANTELVLVEASEPQIEAVLQALDRDSDHVVAVDVEPAPELPRQQQYARFARGLGDLNERQQRQAGAFEAKLPANKAAAANAAESRPQSKTAAEAKQRPMPGIARRLVVHPTAPAADADNKPAEPAGSGESRLQKGDKAQSTSKSTPASGPEGERADSSGASTGDADRLQVLFVLHPGEAEKPAAKSEPGNNQD